MSPNTHKATPKTATAVRSHPSGRQSQPHLDRLNRLLLLAKVLER